MDVLIDKPKFVDHGVWVGFLSRSFTGKGAYGFTQTAIGYLNRNPRISEQSP
jgi:hypothetical protein